MVNKYYFTIKIFPVISINSPRALRIIKKKIVRKFQTENRKKKWNVNTMIATFNKIGSLTVNYVKIHL